MKTATVQVEVKQHPHFPETHWLAIVTTNHGRCYFCTWAGEQPSDGAVLHAWQEDRWAFSPYCG